MVLAMARRSLSVLWMVTGVLSLSGGYTTKPLLGSSTRQPGHPALADQLRDLVRHGSPFVDNVNSSLIY